MRRPLLNGLQRRSQGCSLLMEVSLYFSSGTVYVVPNSFYFVYGSRLYDYSNILGCAQFHVIGVSITVNCVGETLARIQTKAF